MKGQDMQLIIKDIYNDLSESVDGTVGDSIAQGSTMNAERETIAETLERLSQGISELTTSEKWSDYLATQAKFHHYSAGNAQLIMYQNPYATQVAGYKVWQSLGRQVRKGEHGLRILAPLAVKDKESGETNIKGFRGVSVFDISQTDGEELPEVATLLKGDDPSGAFTDLAEISVDLGFSVHVCQIESGANGDCNHAAKLIRVSETLAPAAKVKTLAHEISHALLHAPESRGEMTRGLIELEAESSAFVVCSALGIDSGDYSFGYVARWSGGGEDAIKAIKHSQGRIHKASAQIIAALESLASERVPA